MRAIRASLDLHVRSPKTGADCGSTSADAAIDPDFPKNDQGPSCFDVRHNWRFNLLYHFPNMKSNGFASKLVNGWWMGNIVSVQSGYAFTPTLSNGRSNSGLGSRSDVGTATQAATFTCTAGQLVLYKQPVCDSTGHITLTYIPFNNSTVVQGDPTQWFNPLMFALSPMLPCPTNPTRTCGIMGTGSRDMLRGPGLRTWDFSVVKDTAMLFLGENGSLQFRAEFFNVLNHANFGMPSAPVFPAKVADIGPYSEVPNATVGQIAKTVTASRQIQLALKRVF